MKRSRFIDTSRYDRAGVLVRSEVRTYMLFAGWEVRIVKKPEAAGRGQHFQGRGHSFSLYGPTLSR